MGKIRSIILRKDRTKDTLKISSDSESFKYKKGIYNVDIEAVNNANPAMVPELVFFEDIPSPIGSKSSPVKLLDKQIIMSVIDAASHPRGMALEIIADYLRNPAKLILLAFAAAILIAVLQGVFV